MTAMIELGALLGALNQGWIADKISRRYSIVCCRHHLHDWVYTADCRCRLCHVDGGSLYWRGGDRYAVDGCSVVHFRDQ